MNYYALHVCILVLVISSCVQHREELNVINTLQYINKEHIVSINNLETESVESALLLANLNLLALEGMKLDSVSFNLIYLDYKLYLNCINNIYSSMQVVKNIKQELSENTNQLENLKSDYMNSNYVRKDLDRYLESEIEYIENTSKHIVETINIIKLEILNFYSLNKSIENIIIK
tara:strand:+ start:29 stop:553 length:525 start_codon:yes stop_codon:yes gene_type:complete